MAGLGQCSSVVIWWLRQLLVECSAVVCFGSICRPMQFSDGGCMLPSAAEISIEQVSSVSSKCTVLDSEN